MDGSVNMPAKAKVTEKLPSTSQVHPATASRAELSLESGVVTPTRPNVPRLAVPSTPVSTSNLTSNPPASSNGDLIGYAQRSVKVDEDFFFLRFESLQRTNIVALEVKLLRIKANIKTTDDISDKDLDVLRETLEQYSGWNLSIV